MATIATLKQIRRRVGRLTGDMLLLKATAYGTSTTLIDTVRANFPDGQLRNRQGIFSGGTFANLGNIVRVTTNHQDSNIVEFTPGVPEPTAIDDELELWNERAEGITPDAVHELINDAILDVAEYAPIAITSDEFGFNGENPVISVNELTVGGVPSGHTWEGVTGVDYRDDGGIWHPINNADFVVDRYARTVEIKNRNRWLAHNHLVRVRGMNLPEPLLRDDDATNVDFEWITHHVAVQALGMRLEKAYDRREVEGNLMRIQGRADAFRPKVFRRLKGKMARLD